MVVNSKTIVRGAHRDRDTNYLSDSDQIKKLNI
jgi:hypothetical protein